MSKEAILGFVRHIMTFGGGFVSSEGLATADEVQAAVAGLVAVIGLVWSIIKNSK